MEILLLVLLVGLVGWWFFLRTDKSKSSLGSSSAAVPYKVEAPQPEADPRVTEMAASQTPAWHTAPAEGSELAKNTLDVNNDGKVNLQDAVEVVKKARGRVKKVVDVDGDGKVTTKDVKSAAKKVKAKATKKVATMKAKSGRSKKA